MANRLASATSPYLLQHAENPVEWWEWGAGGLRGGPPPSRARAAERRVRRLPLVPRGSWFGGRQRELTKPQVSGGVAVHVGSGRIAVGRRFRAFVHHSRASLGPSDLAGAASG